MKFKILSILLLSISWCLCAGETSVKISNGFQGNRWGSSVEQVKSKYQEFGNLVVSSNLDSIGDATITIENFKFLDMPAMAQFEFGKNRFLSASIVPVLEDVGSMLGNYKEIRKLLNKKYGAGKDQVDRKTTLGGQDSVKEYQIKKLDSSEKFSTLDETAVSSGIMAFNTSWEDSETKIVLYVGKFGGSSQTVFLISYTSTEIYKKMNEENAKKQQKKIDGL